MHQTSCPKKICVLKTEAESDISLLSLLDYLTSRKRVAIYICKNMTIKTQEEPNLGNSINNILHTFKGRIVREAVPKPNSIIVMG